MPEPRIPIWLRQSSASRSQDIHKTIAKWLPVVALVSLTLWFCISKFFHLSHPPVGSYIGVLAFLAGLVTIWPPDNSWAKAGWLIVFGGFLVLEITTLYQQRAEDIETARTNRITEDNRFADLLKVQQQSFAEVLRQNQRDFDATVGRLGNIFNTMTGGKSYLYFEPQAPDDNPIGFGTATIPSGSVIISAYPTFVGSFPLRDVYVSISGPRPGLPEDIDYGTVFPGETGRPRQIIQAGIDAHLSKAIYTLFINTSNGSYNQEIYFLKIGRHWVWASRFGLATPKRPRMRKWSSPDFPKDQLEVNWYLP